MEEMQELGRYFDFMTDVESLVRKGLVQVERDIDTDEARLRLTPAGWDVLREAQS